MISLTERLLLKISERTTKVVPFGTEPARNSFWIVEYIGELLQSSSILSLNYVSSEKSKIAKLRPFIDLESFFIYDFLFRLLWLLFSILIFIEMLSTTTSFYQQYESKLIALAPNGRQQEVKQVLFFTFSILLFFTLRFYIFRSPSQQSHLFQIFTLYWSEN